MVAGDVVQNHDVWVHQRRGCAGFLQKPPLAVNVPELVVGQDFDGHVSMQPRVASPLYLAHATCAKRGKDFVGAEFITYGKGHTLDLTNLTQSE